MKDNKHFIPPFPVSSIPGVTWPGIPSADGAMMLSILGQMNESQWWPLEVIEQLQHQQLKSLVKHAQETVPFYQDRLPDIQFDESLRHSLDAIPILDRKSVQENFENLQCVNLDPSHGDVFEQETSGSTAIPLKLRHSSMYKVFEGCNVLRQHRWHEFDYAGKLVGISPGMGRAKRAGRTLDAKDEKGWGWPVSALYRSGLKNAISVQETVADQAQWLKQQNADYLVTTPSALGNLVDHCVRAGIQFEPLKKISSVMEILSPDLRERVKSEWNVEIVDNYSCREVGTIAIQSPDSEHFHVMAENCIVEILDENGKLCSPGQIGRVVVTNLRNFAMPLIRYELHDHAEVGQPCPSGRGLPVLKRILGRTRNMLKLPNGDLHWPGMGRPHLVKIIPVKQFQYIQTKIDTIQLNLIVERSVSESEEDAIRNLIHSRLPYPYEIDIRYPAKINLGPGGKVEDFICQV